MKIYESWTTLKTLASSRHLNLQFKEYSEKYLIFVLDDVIEYETEIWKNTDAICGININQNNIDKIDFENNYKVKINKSVEPRSEDGKEILRAESRPLGHTTVFVGQADAIGIGDGKVLAWDFSNDNDLIFTPSGSGLKRKRLEFKFIDFIYIKEGCIYYHNTLKGSSIDMYVVCPQNNYYYDNNSLPKLATEDIVVSHYVIHHPIQGTVAMGDELNTESCSSQIPSNYKFWIDITVPEEDILSNGAVELEIYRKRTVVL